MDKKILIYGINQQAQQLYYYINRERQREIVAFVVDEAYKKGDSLLGLPVVCFENVEATFPPSDYEILLSFGYKNMVRNRQQKYNMCKEKGYTLASFISKDAKVYTDDIGESVVIYPNTIVAPYTKIGKGCFLEISCSIAHHTQIGEFVFFAPGVTVIGNVKIGNNCFFGANSTIATKFDVGDQVVVGAGVCITAEVKPYTAYRHIDGFELKDKSEKYI